VLDLRTLDPAVWVTNGADCWEVAERLDSLRHYPLLGTPHERSLRTRDGLERRAQALRDHQPPARVRRRWAEKRRAARERRRLAR
jgi:hypothetical protein